MTHPLHSGRTSVIARDRQRRIQDFGLGGTVAEGLKDGSPPAGSRGRAAVGIRGPQKPEECYVMKLNKRSK